MAFGFGDQALFFGGGEGFDPLTFDLGLLQYRRNQFFLAAIDFRFLYFDLLFFFDLHDLHLLGDDLLLHDVGLDVVRFVGLRLLLLGDFEYCAFLISRSRCASACLAWKRSGPYAPLIGLRLATADRAAPRAGWRYHDRLSGGNVGVALDACDVSVPCW